MRLDSLALSEGGRPAERLRVEPVGHLHVWIVAVCNQSFDGADVTNHRRPLKRPVHLVSPEAMAFQTARGDVTNLIAARCLAEAVMEAEAPWDPHARYDDLWWLCSRAARKPYVQLVRVALRRPALVLGELVIKRLERRVAKGADAQQSTPSPRQSFSAGRCSCVASSPG